ncbi:hypothetical protein OF117_00865 [Geodermatophilus sp. YIM 151500]|uniref:hypothetical protein n=1 Tax=Geodermatophilus sp. YIM 151500 TaxID=2984531 RepID=UPI0021E3FFB6|nr:hypothetical protein [Geodermatophilus sp. YIM 151500]MCV2487898.1 hypothetical protein [Geodermatophilus sp. YIM 151500]
MDVADEEHVPIEKHEATDRFGKAALRAAHDIGRALADEDPGGDPGEDPTRDRAGDSPEDMPYVEPVLVRRGGPHRSLAGLAALIDAALDEHASGAPTSGDDRPPTGDPDAERRVADEDGDGSPAGADDAG